MHLALRPYAAAGVALATASVIVAAPAIAPPIEIQTRAVQMVALDNPIEVFTPVFDKATTVFQNAVQAEIAAPFPVVNALIGKATTDAKTLGGFAKEVTQSLSTIGTTLPPALQTAFQSLAAGDFNGYVAAFTPVFMGPFLSFQGTFFKVTTWVESQFVMAGAVARHVLNRANGLTLGQALNLLAPINAITDTLTQLAQVAIPSGDPAQIANTVQHGIANITIATLTFADRWRTSLESTRVRLGAIINPPSPAALSAADTSSPATPEPATAASQTPVTTPESPSLNDDSVPTPEEKAATTTVAVKAAPVAKAPRANARTAANNSVRESAKNLSAGIKKATDGIKQAAQRLSGKKAKTASGSDGAAK